MLDTRHTLVDTHSLSPGEPLCVDTRGTITPAHLAHELYVKGEPFHFDVETTGLDADDPEQHVVGIGLATSKGYGYVDVTTEPESLGDLFSQPDYEFIAFNTVFDGAWAYKYTLPQIPKLVGCSLILYRNFCNEGHKGQLWSLESAQENILGWNTSQKSWLSDKLSEHKIPKKDMWKLSYLEPDDFGRYCAMDAEASRQLWGVLTSDKVMGKFPSARWYHEELQMSQVRRAIVQQFSGMCVDRDEMKIVHEDLLVQMCGCIEDLRRDPVLAPHIEEWEDSKAREFFKEHVTVKKIWARKSDQPWLDPSTWYRYTSAKLKAWEKEHGCRFFREERKVTVPNANKEPPKFNFNSNAQLGWLFYERIYKCRRAGNKFIVTVDGKTVELEATTSGNPPVNKKALMALGRPGALLLKYNKLLKKEGYIKTYLDASSRDGRIHLKLRPAATLNGRCAGGG